MSLIGPRPVRVLLVFLVGAALPARAFAQERPPTREEQKRDEPQDEPQRFETSVDVEEELPALPPSSTAATRLPVAVKDLPATIAVLPRRLLDEQDAFVLTDALRNASGVNVATGFGVFDFFVIRGFDSLSSSLVLTDGVAEPESTFYPLYNVRQVEVLKGPAAFLYGANPLSGAVQIVRKQPQGKRYADLSFSYGRFSTYAAGLDANASTRDSRVAFRLNAAYQGTAGYRELPRGSIKAANPALAWRPDARTRLGLNFEYLRSEWPPDTGIPFVGASGEALAPVPRTRSYQSPFDGSDQDVYRLRLDFDRRIGDKLTLRNRFYFTDLAWLSDGTLLVGVVPGPDGQALVARTLALLDDRQRRLGNQLELVASAKTGALGHELLVGVELARLTDRFTQDVGLLPPEDLLAPVESAQRPIVTLPQFGQAGDSRSIVVAPYLVDRLTLSRRLQAFLGGRLDVLDYEDPQNTTTRDATRLSPLVGIVHSPFSRLALHLSWSSAFAPPSTQVVGPREPERSRQLELGGKLTFRDGKGFAGLALYQLDKDNIAIPDTTGITRQAGDQRSRGLELDVSAEPAKGFVSYASYALTDAVLTRFSEIVPLLPPDFVVLDRSSNRAPFAPRHLLNLWTSKQLGRGVGVALGLRYLSDQFISEDNRYRIGGYLTLDAALSYRRGRSRFSLNLKNLTGTEYETRGFGSVSAIPARPFELLARAEIGVGKR